MKNFLDFVKPFFFFQIPLCIIRLYSSIEMSIIIIIIMGGETGGKEPLGRPRRRWANTIRMDLQMVGCVYMDWIGLVKDRDRWWTLVSAVMNFRVP